MPRFVLLAVFAALTLFVMRRATAASRERLTAADNPADDIRVARDDPNYWFSTEQGGFIGGFMGTPEQNLLAILALIREFEANGRYDVLYGGDTFDMSGEHPRVKVPINLPGYEGKFSTAAGAYQFNWPTWKEVAAETGLWDMSPASQDANAIRLLEKIGAIPAINQGDFDTALRIASRRWASLPYSEAKQSPKSIAAANEFLTRYISTLA